MISPRRLAIHVVLGMSVRDHIGGRWAIPWIALAITFPLNILATIATNVSPDGDGTVAQWLVASLAGIAAMIIVLLLARVTLLRRASVHPVPIWVVGLIGAATGALRVPAMDLALQAMGLSSLTTSAFITRIVPSAVVGLVLLPLGAFVVSVIYQFRTQRRALVEDEITLQQSQMRAEGATAALREALVQQVESDLSTAIATVDHDREALQESLQRTGRELWEPVLARTDARFRWGQVLLAGLRRNPLPAGLVLVIWVPTAVMGFVTYLDWQMTIVRTIAAAVAIAAVFAVGRWWIRRQGHSSVGVLVGVLVGSWVLTSPVPWLVSSDRPIDVASATMIANAVWLSFITIMSGMAVAAISSTEEIVRDLRTKVSEAEIHALAADEELAIVRRELGAQLHGPVRSRLNTATAVLRGVGGSQPSQVGSELHAALHSLTEANEQPPTAGQLRDAVSRALDPWRPLLDIEVSCPTVMSKDAQAAAIVVEEAIANAYRHGKAENVRVEITQDGSGLRIVVDDDGTGIRANPEPGLGSRLLDHHARDHWSREALPAGGTRLQVTLGAVDQT